MSKTFIISDSHFFHNNIIKYCGRPIDHETIIWSKLEHSVKPDDTLIHCGDVIFVQKKKGTKAKEVFENLPGKKKILVVGNHDKQIKNQKWDLVTNAYQFVYGGVIIHCQHFSYKSAENIHPGLKRFFRFFFPDWCNRNLRLPEADICIHGHTHNLGQRFLWIEKTKQLIVNVCPEWWDYRPICIDELVYEWRQRMAEQNVSS